MLSLLTPAQAAGCRHALTLLEGLTFVHLIGGRGYDTDDIPLASGGAGLAWAMLHALGFVIIAMAIVGVARHLLEEEVFRGRELGTPSEVRRALAKLLTIVIITLSLEALVPVFEQGKESPRLIGHPVVLFLAAVIGVVGLGRTRG